jgi:HD superfamily phosphodiesterase
VTKIDAVKTRVQHLFDEQDRRHAGFPWMYENHIRLLEEEADGLLDECDADEKVVRLAALLHDIGYIGNHKNQEEVGFWEGAGGPR